MQPFQWLTPTAGGFAKAVGNGWGGGPLDEHLAEARC